MRILIPESQAMGSVACIRSLGRAGHHVVATSSDPQALGFHSRFCDERVVQPPGLTGQAFAAWICQLVEERSIDLVLPSEGLVAGLGDSITRLADKLPVGPDVNRLQRFVGKFALFEHFQDAADRRLSDHLPGTLLLKHGQGIDEPSLRRLQLPLFGKFDSVGEKGLGSKVVKFDSHDAALSRLPPLLADYGRGILQEFAPGQGVGVFFLRWNGQILASLMHRRIHEVPHDGGVSSFRETWWNDALYEDAERRIHSMDWWGVGMLEYRWDAATGRFQLMEFNARFWGSLHLALFAQVDFPRLLVDAWAGKVGPGARAASGVRCRLTFPKEIEHLWSLWRDPDVAAMRKVKGLATFMSLSLDPRIYSDLWFPGDTGLYWRALARTPGKFLR